MKNHFLVVKFIFLVLLLGLASCKQNNFSEISEFYDLGNEGMISKMEYEFQPFKEIPYDSVGSAYELKLTIRFLDRFNQKELPIVAEWYDTGRAIFEKDTVLINLFSNQFNKAGKGNFGFYEIIYPLTKIKNPDENFVISVMTPETNTKGLISLGVICDKIN